MFAPGSVCFAAAKANETYTEITAQPARWTCSEGRDVPQAERHFIRHDLRGVVQKSGGARYLAFIRSDFAQMEISVRDAAGAAATSTFGLSDFSVGRQPWEAFVKLPQTREPPLAAILTVDAARTPAEFVSAKITAEPPIKLNAGMVHLIAAILCGMLLAPVLFDLGFQRTLRESFPLFHAMFCLAAMVQTASISGLIPVMFDLSAKTQDLIAYLSFDLMLTAMVLFVRSFIEPGVIDRWHRHLLTVAAFLPLIANLLVNFATVIPLDLLNHTIYGCLGMMLIALFYVMTVAWRRGSRAIRYVTLAFMPLLTIGVLRITGSFIPAFNIQFDEMWPQNFALAFEVSVTAFAVADRFLTIKRERDKAVDEARSLETLSERDALTGLLNRRALEDRFEALRAQGFTALAVVDLDHFKRVNDTFGHQVGDTVLTTAAQALTSQEDDDLLAFRIGGEEFLLLLRGRAMQARAEERRRAITDAIARDTTIGLHVTASMGYLDAAPGALGNASFESLYERADRLLYEAKANGRNRMMAEKVTVFQRRLGQRREDQRAA